MEPPVQYFSLLHAHFLRETSIKRNEPLKKQNDRSTLFFIVYLIKSQQFGNIYFLVDLFRYVTIQASGLNFIAVIKQCERSLKSKHRAYRGCYIAAILMKCKTEARAHGNGASRREHIT